MRFISYIYIFTLCATITMIMCEENVQTIAPSVALGIPKDFFNLNNSDEVTWAHEVNTKPLLQKALENDKIMMLEADVLLGTVTGGEQSKKLPIMSHSKTESDLTLSDFLQNVIQKKKKGIKLDFKTTEALIASVEILKNQQTSMNFPIFLNADILLGPNMNDTAEPKPVTAEEFLTKAKEFQNCILSIGWTTKIALAPQNKYEESHFNAMLNLVDIKDSNEKITQMITYPVRAGIIENTEPAIVKTLLTKTKTATNKDATLTIWSHDDDVDNIDITKLKKFMEEVGHNNFYLDLSPKVLEAVKSAAADHLPGIVMVLAMIVANFFYTTL